MTSQKEKRASRSENKESTEVLIDKYGNTKETTERTARAVIEYLLSHPNTTKKQLTGIKCQIGKRFGYKNVIRDSIIMQYATPQEKERLGPLLRRRYTRTLSGVTIVAVMTKPYPCPGKCIYCPGPESQPGVKVAQSYTGREPAAMRSAMYNYDAYQQTFHRLKDLASIGHNVDKIELIIMGGTFFYMPKDYQDEFVKGCFDAIINFGKKDYNNHKRTLSLKEAKKKLETSEVRLIGLTFETRPDYCTPEYIDRMLDLGATRVEIGVQTVYEEILEKVKRGHTVEQSIKAIQAAKDSGLKVNLHMMPNLPGSTPQKDIEAFRILFNDSHFRPDMLKIYPTLVVKGTTLYKWYKEKKYIPYSEDEVIRVIAEVKKDLPPYVRIQRIQRDIPAPLIIDGVKSSNLRQLVQNYLKSKGERCKCIRCREEGFIHYEKVKKRENVDTKNIELLVFEYDASEGKEYFISFEDKNRTVLMGYLRLRFPSSKAHRPEIKDQNAAIIREIRVVGEIVPHTAKPQPGQIQHRGFGKALIKKAEEIAREAGKQKMLVIAGIGVRPYFYKLGYEPDGPYVSKKL